MINLIINLLSLEDYYFVVPRGSKYNSSNKSELHTLNSESPVAIGVVNILRELNSYRSDHR